MKAVLASKNAHKLKEIEKIVSAFGMELVLQSELGIDIDVEETGTTFEENSMLKARAVMEAAGMPAIADDSGLMVDALGGEPGVYSARYAPVGQRKATVLQKLAGLPLEQRGAGFVSAVCCVFPDGRVLRAEGAFEGEIAFAPAGENGFGYDPIFLVGDRTSSQMSPAEKDAVSHRGKALAIFADKLTELLNNK